MLKEKCTLEKGFEDYYQAVEYKSIGNCTTSSKILKKIIREFLNETTSVDKIHLLLLAEDTLAEIHVLQNRFKEAIDCLKKSIVIIDRLLKDETQNIKLQEKQALHCIQIAQIYLKQEKYTYSSTYYSRAVKLYKSIKKNVKE
jgi:tetratricopeptide (TPR) repeat protein